MEKLGDRMLNMPRGTLIFLELCEVGRSVTHYNDTVITSLCNLSVSSVDIFLSL